MAENDGIVSVKEINNAYGSVIEVIGVGNTSNRFDSEYNGTFRVTGITSTNSITYSITDGANTDINAGFATSFNGHQGLVAVTGKSVGVSTIDYTNTTTGIVTVTTTDAHGLLVGNKFRITGSGATIYNGFHNVNEVLSQTEFTIDIGAGTTNPDFESNTDVFLLKSSFNSQKSRD